MLKALLGLPLVFSLACSAAPDSVERENAAEAEDKLEIVTHNWHVNADGSVGCDLGEDAHEAGGEHVGAQQQLFVTADNYGYDDTVPNDGSVPTGSRCPFVRNGRCDVPGVKSFTWKISGMKTTGNPDLTNLAFFGLGDSLDYHKANSAMKWSFKTSKPRVIFKQDSTVPFAQSDIGVRRVHSSSTFGTVSASVPDELAILVRFNYDAFMRSARAIGINDYWSFRVYFEHVFSHEMGHVSGLGHSPNSADLMYYTTHRNNWSTNWLTNAELQAIAVFQPGDWNDATVLDLDL
jgi:Matrixin